MLFATPILFLANSGVTVDDTVLEYRSESFTLRQGKSVFEVPILPTPSKSSESLSYRRDDNYAVWDSRGLTIRHGDKSTTTKLEDVPTSSRLFEHPVLVQTVADVASGKKQRSASALSGAVRVGTDVYFLVRWEDSTGKPWMEALIHVPLAGDSLKPEVLGRFDALSIAYKPMDDRMSWIGSHLSIVARQGKTWGVASYDPTASKFDFRPLGDDLISYIATSQKTGLFFEKSPYGTTVGGRIDLFSGYRKIAFEARGAGRFLDAVRPSLILSSRNGEARLRNGDTGGETIIPPGSGVARAGQAVLVWSPATKPTTATAYDPERWVPLAKWSAKP